jgi:hypothetical protein
VVKTLKKKRRGETNPITTRGGYPFVLYSGDKPDIMMPKHNEFKKARERLSQLQEDLDNAERRLVINDPMKYQRPGFSFEGPRLFGRSSPYLSLGPRPNVDAELHSPWGF